MRNATHDFWFKLREKFDLNASGQVVICCVVLGFLSGIGAAFFYTGLKFTETQVSNIYIAAGITFPAPPETAPKKKSNPESRTIDIESGRREIVKEVDSEPKADEFYWTPKRSEKILGLLSVPKYWILLLLVPALGGLFCGLIIHSVAPEASTEGIDSIIKSFHRRSGMMRTRAAFARAFASIPTIGTGGSGGIEGGVMMFGAGLGNLLSNRMKFNAQRRRLLLLAGAAGGLGAVFQCPLGGAVLVAEILYCTTALELSIVIPCFISSIVAFHTFRLICGGLHAPISENLLGIGGPGQSMVFILLAIVFAFCCAGSGTVFVRLVHEFRNRFFRRWGIPEAFKPAIGGFMVGCIILFCPQVRGTGGDWLELAVGGSLPLVFVLVFFLTKILGTSCTISSGGSGGYLVPSLLVGALLGNLFGQCNVFLFESIGFGHLAPEPIMFALIGMGAFYAGIAKVPLAATIIVCEFAGVSYVLTLPLITVGLLHMAIHSPRTSLYEEQLLGEVDSPAHLGEYLTDLLDGIPVSEALRKEHAPLCIPKDMLLPEIFKLTSGSGDTVFPVLDEEGAMLGYVTADDIQSAFLSHGNRKRLTAEDLMQRLDSGIRADDNLLDALKACYLKGISECPVLAPENPRKILAMLRKEDIIAEYNRRLGQFRESGEDEPK